MLDFLIGDVASWSWVLGLSIAEKKSATEEFFTHALELAPLERIAVAWTGGKDSTLLLYLWRQWLLTHGLAQGDQVRALSVDTGYKFPETLAFRDQVAQKWNVALTICRPQCQPEQYPVAVDVVQCCRELKIVPLQQGLQRQGIQVLLTGLRRDEHPKRERRASKEKCPSPPHVRLHPILPWTEMDVWAMHIQSGLPYCPLYDQGYRSLGCWPCTRLDAGGERAGRNPDKESQLDTLRSLGYF
ncbi:MAG: phosphoadenosine phosphosulfate reductase family protein [Desulfohalobium sp.]